MSREELLGWIGIVIGLPGVAVLLFDGQLAVAILVLLMVAAFIWFAWCFNRPVFTILEVHKVLRFLGPDGASAVLVRTQRARANHPASEFWFRGMASDGHIENIRIDGAPPARVIHELGATHACKQFAHPLKRGTVSSIRLEYDLRDSFPNRTEALLHSVSESTKELRLDVEFHPGKPCRSARLFKRYSGGEKQLSAALHQTPDGLSISARVKRPKVGSEYELEWDW